MLNAFQIKQKIILFRLFHQAIDETLKIPEKVLTVSVSNVNQSIAVQLYQPMLIRWLSLLCVYY